MRKIIPLLGKLFNIRRDEWPRFLLIYLLYFITLTGMQWGRPTVEAAFVTAVGVKFLPWVFVINAFVTIAATAVYTAFADRVDNTRLLIALFVASVVGISLGLVLLIGDVVAIIYPLILLFLVLNVPLLDIFNVHWPTYVNSFYNTQSAKRIIPLLASGARFAGIVAGLTLPYLNSYFESSTAIIFIWLITLIISIAIAWLIPYLLKEKEPIADQQIFAPLVGTTKPSHSYLGNIKEGFHYVQQSTFLRWLAVAALLTFVLLPLINFQALQILEGQFDNEKDISNFIATLTVIGNLIALPIQLFILNRLIGRIGLGNTSLIFPFSTLAISVTLFFQRLIPIPAAALGYLNSTVFRTTFRNPVDNLWYNAVPLRVKGRARAFIVGFVVPIGGLIGGLLLLIPNLPQTWLLALIGVLAVGFVVTALIVRQQYAQALISMLEQEDFSFLFSQEGSSLNAADPATLDTLTHKLDESDSPELTVFIAQLICQTGGNAAAPILGQASRKTKDGSLRAALLDVMTAADLGGKAVRELYIDFLADTEGQVRQSALVGLERLAGPEDERFISLLLNMLHDPDINVRVQVLSALARSGNFYRLPAAVESLNQFLADQDPERRAHAVRILGQIGDLRAIRNLTDYLSDPEDAVRLAAAVSVEPLLKERLPDSLQVIVVERMQHLLKDPIERVRQAALHGLRILGHHESYEAMVEALADPSPLVRATAVEMLVQIGKAIIPMTHARLDSPDLESRTMAGLVLGRIDPRQFGGLIQSHITSNLLTIYRNYGYIDALAGYLNYSSVPILQNVLYEQNQELRDEIFYILGAIHDPSAVEVITDTLQSENSRVRANAIEALESLTDPQTAQLVAPLFQTDSAPTQLLRLSQDTWQMQPIEPDQAIRQIISDPNVSWLRAIMTYALGEMGVALLPKGKNGDDGNNLPERKARRRRIDPLEALSDITNDDKQRKRRSQKAALLDQLTEADQEAPLELDEAVEASGQAAASKQTLLTLSEIDGLLDAAAHDPVSGVRSAARTARRMLAGIDIIEEAKKEDIMLSTIERIIFLKKVSFFKGMAIGQLEVLAKICEEALFEEDQWIFHQGDAGGALYVIISGQVGIEQEKRKGSYARLATLGAYQYFGEMTLLDSSPRSAGAVALQDTFILRVRREPLIALARQYPDLSLELISVLSQRLRQANDRIAELTRSRPRQLQKLFDKFE